MFYPYGLSPFLPYLICPGEQRSSGVKTCSKLGLFYCEGSPKTPKQVALAWLLKRSPVTLPIPGTSSIEHLEENIQAALLRLTDEEYRELTNVSEPPRSFRS